MIHPIFLFGAAEQGTMCKPVLIHCLGQLFDQFGHLPKQTEGIYYAIQSLLCHQQIIYFRVSEEGGNPEDYFRGFHWIKKTSPRLRGICLPGVGNQEIIHSLLSLCHVHQSLLIMSEKDLYDYLTSQ